MTKFIVGLFFGLLSESAWAAGPQSHAQLYDLKGNQDGQVVMLSNWTEGQRFSTYEESPDAARKYFPEGSKVWIWCDGKSSVNQVKKIDTSGYGGWTTVDLAKKPVCGSTPLLMSNHVFPKQRWSTSNAPEKDVQAIQKKVTIEKGLQVTAINSEEKGSFYLVFDPTISSVYEMGGYRLLNGSMDQISVFEGSPLPPLIDLNNDTFPEFFFPSSDGLDAWIYELFPKLDMENSHYDEFIRNERKRLGIDNK
ncbi:MAG: hypothetical protein OER85_10160 [Gammaproteobacteria bacterium]|nr:hypothetical protein [Gammaproteobacteria bacterium]